MLIQKCSRLHLFCVQALFIVILLLVSIECFAQDRTCPKCHGKGIIYVQHAIGTFGHSNTKKQCPICFKLIPSGVSHSHQCPTCNGSGSISRSTTNNTRLNSNASVQSDNSVETYGLSAEVNQQMINIMNAQLQGYDGFMDENNCYGNIYKYNPKNHIYLPELTDKIIEWNKCANGAFTTTGSGVIIADKNSFWAKNLPTELLDKLFEINKNGQAIRDVALSEGGTYWCVIFNFNGWYGYLPQTIRNQLNAMVELQEGISSIAFDDFGNYVIVGDNGTVFCSSKYQKCVNDAKIKFGKIKNASVTMHWGCVLCCERGVYFNGISSSVADVLKNLNYIPRVVETSYTGHFLITSESEACMFWF